MLAGPHDHAKKVQAPPTNELPINHLQGDDTGVIRGNLSLPMHYNVREEYPHCTPQVLDQGPCGACWGFAAAGILGDRMCMQSNGRYNNLTLSPQDMVNCAYEGYGCKGGYLIPAVDFMITEGVARLSCIPYEQ